MRPGRATCGFAPGLQRGTSSPRCSRWKKRADGWPKREAIAGTDEQLMKRVLIAESELATRRGDLKRVSEVFDRLHRIAQAMTDNQEKHRVALHLAQAHAGNGDRAAAVAKLEEAEHLLPGDRSAQVERTQGTGRWSTILTRDFRSAALHAEQAVDMGRELGLTYEVMINLHNLADALVHLDDLPRAYGAIRQSLALCEECVATSAL